MLSSKLKLATQQSVLRTARTRILCRNSSTAVHQDLPSQADVVIIGGGSVGASTLFNLTKAGVSNAVLLEKDKLTAGTTWHSAGLVWRLRPSETDINLISKTREITDELLSEEYDPGWINNGGMFIASTTERVKEYERLNTFGKNFGIDSKLLDPHEAKKMYPLMNVDDVNAVLFSPGDGTLDPSGWVQSLTGSAKKKGAKIFEHTSVIDVLTETMKNGKRKVVGVKTDKGIIKTNHVVNACGSWSKLLGDKLGVKVPLCSMHHAYVTTEGIEELAGLPNIRDHDLSLYLKISGTSMHVGGYENNPVFWDKVQENFAFSLFDLDWDIFETHLTHGMQRVPKIAEVGINSTVCGPESFTPDHKPLMGEVPEIKGFYLNCGFNSAGIMLSGGAGYELANIITKGRTETDVYSLDITRFHNGLAGNEEWIKARSHEAYAKNYSIVFPQDEPLAGRNSRKDPFHKQMLKAGCVFQERLGFERPGYFKPGLNTELRPYDYYGNYGFSSHENYTYNDLLEGELTFDWGGSFDTVKKEVLNCRNNVSVFNQSYFGKLILTGPDAQKAVDWICTNDMDKPVGSVVYTNMLNEKGGAECDLTVSRLEDQNGMRRFYIACGGGSTEKDKKWISKVVEDNNFDIDLIDNTEKGGMLSIQGPKSRALLSELSETDFSNESFPFSTCQIIKVAGHECLALRLTFVGEMGWELHIPNESCDAIYEALFKTGEKYNIMNAGYLAIDVMSNEKGYKHWHEDLKRDDTPLEAGLGFICKLKKDTPFLGRVALENQQKNGLKRRLGAFVIDDSEPLYGSEVLYREGKVAGFVCRTAFSHAINKTVAWVYVYDSDNKAKVNLNYLRKGEKYEIESRGRMIPATYHEKAIYDPKNLKIKGEIEKLTEMNL